MCEYVCEVVEIVSKDDDSVQVAVPSVVEGGREVRSGWMWRVRRGKTYGGLTYEELAAVSVGSTIELRKPLTDEERPSTA